MNKIDILYEDKDILVCSKPAGIAVQSSNVTIPDMETLLRTQILRSNKNNKESAALHIIHRLDQPVEGIIVFARNKKAAAKLSSQVQCDGDMNKTYLAVTYGSFPDDKKNAELRNFLYKDPKSKCAVIVDSKTFDKNGNSDNNRAKECLLSYEVLSEKIISQSLTEDVKFENDQAGSSYISLVEIHLQTGRFHQIRAQFSHIGHPLLGDRRYGTPESTELSAKLNVRNVALCASKLSFRHPSTNKIMNFEIKPSGAIFSEILAPSH